MATARITHNPGIFGDDELIGSFVVRHDSLTLILETLRDNAASQGMNRHMMIIGPRGVGKTMLVRRAAAEVRRDPELGRCWHPVVFSEESYSVSSAGEFWLEALSCIADKSEDPQRIAAVEELRGEMNDKRLRDRCLAQLLDFADSQGKRLLLVVENLNMMLDEQISEQAAWDLRHTLSNEPRFMLLGTATSRFEQIENAGQAWFGMFSMVDLKPLDQAECQALWDSATGGKIPDSQMRAIRILTGGSPRLLRMLASFAANRSFQELMEQLVHLLDEHTEYFKSHLDYLGPKERKVFAAVLEIWDPVTTGQVARRCRLSVNEVSVLLGRLVQRGAVEVVESRPRRKLYQAAERLYNIYYLMRLRGESARVRAAVRFMVTLYGSDVPAMIQSLISEAISLPNSVRSDHYSALIELCRSDPAATSEVMRVAPWDFVNAAPPDLRLIVYLRAFATLLEKLAAKCTTQGIELDSEAMTSLIKCVMANKTVERELALDRAFQIDDNGVWIVFHLAVLTFAAAAGAGPALALAGSFPHHERFEALMVGLRLYNGEVVHVAQEIHEIGTEIVRMIEETKKGIEGRLEERT
jgi:hypothetical protein